MVNVVSPKEQVNGGLNPFFARDTAWTKTKQLGSLMKGVLGVKKEERRAEVIRNTQDTHPSSAHLVKVKKADKKGREDIFSVFFLPTRIENIEREWNIYHKALAKVSSGDHGAKSWTTFTI